jgi:hypothetical protein
MYELLPNVSQLWAAAIHVNILATMQLRHKQSWPQDEKNASKKN